MDGIIVIKEKEEVKKTFGMILNQEIFMRKINKELAQESQRVST